MTLRQNPVPPFRVTTPYGVPGDWAAGYHTGDDYSTNGRTGFPVYSTWPGWVLAVGTPWGGEYGLHIVIAGPLGLIRTGYCHLSRTLVGAGDRVHRGQVIAHSGDSGRSTGPHLHYEERRSPFTYGDDRPPRRNYKGNHGEPNRSLRR
jgi:murein DD-endopeptidase MepM/ murein hydrolase activator NlpD